MEDSQSTASTSSNRVTTPPPLTPCRRPTPDKRMHCGQNKRDAIEERLLQIIEKPEKEPDEDEKFCQSLANLSEEKSKTLKGRSTQSYGCSKQCTTVCMAHSLM